MEPVDERTAEKRNCVCVCVYVCFVYERVARVDAMRCVSVCVCDFFAAAAALYSLCNDVNNSRRGSAANTHTRFVVRSHTWLICVRAYSSCSCMYCVCAMLRFVLTCCVLFVIHFTPRCVNGGFGAVLLLFLYWHRTFKLYMLL